MMKKYLLIMVNLLVFLASNIVFAVSFSDLTNEHWAYEPIIEMANKGILSGYPDGTFLPNKPITRAEFAKILVLSLNLKDDVYENDVFDDVDSSHWSYDYVRVASNYLSGYTNGSHIYFMPDEQAVREDMAVAIVMATNLQNKQYDLNTLDRFLDKESISESFRKYVSIAVENNLMRGNADGTFNPKGKLTRAEVSQLMLNTTKELEKIEASDLPNNEKENEGLQIIVTNGYNSNMYSEDKVNKVYPARPFHIIEYTYNDQYVDYDDIEEVCYWFDDEKPIRIEPFGEISAIYANSTYKELNVKTIVRGEETTFKYQIEVKLNDVGVLKSYRKDEDGKIYLNVDGVEFESYFEDNLPNPGDVVFLCDSSYGNYMIYMDFSVQDLNERGSVVAQVNDNNIVFNDSSAISISDIYDLHGSLVYIEYNDNEITHIENTLSSNRESFTVQEGDKILWTRVTVGTFVIARKVTQNDTSEKFFRKGNDDINIISYVGAGFRDKYNLSITIDRYLKEDEKLSVEIDCDNKKIELLNNRIDSKEYNISGQEIFDKIYDNKVNPDGKYAKIIISIVNNSSNKVISKELDTFLIKDDEIKIESDIEKEKLLDKDVTIYFDRDIKDYEIVKVNYYLKTGDGSARGSAEKINIIKVDDRTIKLNLEDIKQNIYNLLNDQQLFVITKKGDKYAAANIYDKKEDTYDFIYFDDVNIEIYINVDINIKNQSSGAKYFKTIISVDELAKKYMNF